MTPKRLRLIAAIIRENHTTNSWHAMAQELERHATELEQVGWLTNPPRIRLEPGTVFDELREQAGRKH